MPAAPSKHGCVCAANRPAEACTCPETACLPSLKKSRLHVLRKTDANLFWFTMVRYLDFLPLLRDAHNGFYLAVSGLSPPDSVSVQGIVSDSIPASRHVSIDRAGRFRRFPAICRRALPPMEAF